MYSATFDLLYGIPFVGLLLSIALMPLIAPHFWHRFYGLITDGWAVALSVIIGLHFGAGFLAHVLVEAVLHHYLPFVMLIGALYVVAGGLHVEVRGQPSAGFNTLWMLAGTVAAGFIGTTGAAMLFIRPLLNLNQERAQRQHLALFFLLLVCNIGGGLSTIGDPPLFVGYLQGVDFMWPTIHLFLPVVCMAIPLLIAFWLYDRRLLGVHRFTKVKIKVSGTHNLLLLLIIVASLVGFGALNLGKLELAGVKLAIEDFVREVLFALIALISVRFIAPKARRANEFSWAPISEVARVFLAIFITATPVIAMLDQGLEGPFAPLLQIVNKDGAPHADLYFWLTGLLSAFLDNAPTYLVFFHMAGGDAQYLMTAGAAVLTAISCGAVFMGAMSYIGNAPNFMIKAIAEERGIAMPSFFGYMVFAFSAMAIPLALVAFLFF
ncbi:MAG: sodium:proton antiporter [Holosporales bacterium]